MSAAEPTGDVPPVAPRPVAAPAASVRPAPAFRPGVLTFLQRPVRRVVRPWLRVGVGGLEHIEADGPYIVAGNHASWLDGPLVVMAATRPMRVLTKVEMYKGPLGWFLHVIGQIPIDRGRPDRTALRAALDELARGGVVGVFPEGSRGSGELQSVQHGVAYLAVRSGAPVLPVATLGTAAALPKGAHFPRRGAPIDIVFGPAFRPVLPANPRSRSGIGDVAEQIRVRLAAHLAEARAARTP